MCEYCGHFAPSHILLGKCSGCDKCDKFNDRDSPTKCTCKCPSQLHEGLYYIQFISINTKDILKIDKSIKIKNKCDNNHDS